MLLSQRVALVTGASRGIGRAIAIAMARQGAAVAINFVNSADAAREVAELINSEGGRAAVYRGDVGSDEDVTRMLAAVEEELGPVDILVNNAGITRDQLLLRMREDTWCEVINTNLSGVFRLTRGVLRQMVRKRYGRIINISSVTGLVGNPGQTNYAAAKAGIIGFTKALAREVGQRGITVNAIAPGYIETEMTAVLDDDIKNRMLGQIALGYFGEPEDVAHAAVFLASDHARYITGHTLVVDGGMTMV